MTTRLIPLRRRAGLTPSSPQFEEVLRRALFDSNIAVYGFYCHAGNAYGSTSPDEASTFLTVELNTVNAAAELAHLLLSKSGVGNHEPFILSVGSTPTAHSATAENRTKLASLLNGTMELHAGMSDLI